MKQYPGYTTLRSEDCPEQHGTLTVLTHDVSGATVLLVENDDVNKAFGIGFGTFSSDDTGVFHILEHSVLAGSEKYPVKSPFLQLLKSSMASFLNAMTFSDKTVYPFATPNETDFMNLLDVYLNAVFCPLAMVDKSVFEQEGWHRDADGTVSGVVYNEMQGALASQSAQLQNALSRAMFPDTAYGFVSGGDPESIPALTYEKYCRVYRRHYSAENCCITLYGKMDMAQKLEFIDKNYLSKQPKTGTRPALTLQTEQPGAFLRIPYYTEKPEPNEVQCALAWYAGNFADRERLTAMQLLVSALFGTNQSPLKAALLEQQLGTDIDICLDDSILQPTLEIVLEGATEDTAAAFAGCVRSAVDNILKQGIPQELLLAALNEAEFDSLERAGGTPDGVYDAVCATTSWLHAGDATMLLHTNEVFASLRAKLGTDWFDQLLRDMFAAEPVQVIQVPTLPVKEEKPEHVRTDGKLVLGHPLTVADLGDGAKSREGTQRQIAGATVLHHHTAGSTYLNFYYDLGSVPPEDMPYVDMLTAVLDELDTDRHTAHELEILRGTWLGECSINTDVMQGRQEGEPCHVKLTVSMSMLERSLEKALEIGGEWLYDTKLTDDNAHTAFELILAQNKLATEQYFVQQGHTFAMLRAASHYTAGGALRERLAGVSNYKLLNAILEQGDWEALGAKLDALRTYVLHNAQLTISLHGSDAAFDTLCRLLPASKFAEVSRKAAQPYTEPLVPAVNEAFIIDGNVNYNVLAWPAKRDASRKVLARVMSYEYLWHKIREQGGAYGTGMLTQSGTELFYTYRDPNVQASYDAFAQGPQEIAANGYTAESINEFIVGTASQLDSPLKPREEAKDLDRRYFCGITDDMLAADRKAMCGVDAALLKQQADALPEKMAGGVRVAFGSRETIEAAKALFDAVEEM